MSARRIFCATGALRRDRALCLDVLFFLVPFGFVLKISLSQTAIAQPPYEPVFDLTRMEALKAALPRAIDNFRLLVSTISTSSLLAASRRRHLDRALAPDRLSHRLRHGAAAERWQAWRWCW